MRLSKIQNVYQLTLIPRMFPVNCYIVEEKEELTLIDTGLPASFKGILQVIEELEKPLTNLILTHAHGDHVGSLDKVKERFPDVMVSISERDSRLLRGDISLDSNEAQTPIKGGIPKKIITTPNRMLKEGDEIGSLEVIETPGHTPGSISLFNRKSGILIAGDAMQTRGRVAVCGQLVPQFPFPAFGTWSKEVSLNSVKKLMKLKPSLLATGHGKMIHNPETLIQQAIDQAEKNISK